MINKIVKNNEIYIPEDLWKELNVEYSKDEIKKGISDAIEFYNIPMPMRHITLNDAIESFDELMLIEGASLIKDSEWFTRYEYSSKYFKTNKVIKSANIGNISSDYFHQLNRWKCDSINAPSPYRTWNSEKFRLTLLNGLWSLKYTKIDMGDLRSLIGLRKYIAAQFRPSAAKCIYETFKAKNVLDFSTGWGDRLCGFMSTEGTVSYTGIDPNNALVDGYAQQIDHFSHNKKIVMQNGCAEDPTMYPDQMYDLIFTSPPYFNIERYSADDTQSYKRYKKIDSWLNEFMFKTLDNCWSKLETGGHLVINISDVYSNHTINKICDPMNDYISMLPNSEYVGCWGYEMRKRPNSGALKNKSGVFAEPIWIWKKL